jgi:hypothetical protein
MIADLDEVLYSGLALGKEEEAWAMQNGVPIKVCSHSVLLDQYVDIRYRICLAAQNVEP